MRARADFSGDDGDALRDLTAIVMNCVEMRAYLFCVMDAFDARRHGGRDPATPAESLLAHMAVSP